MGSYTFSGQKFDDFSRIFQDPTLIYMNLPSTKQDVCVESYVLGINTFTCRNARQCLQGKLENACKPDIHCALVAQWTCAKVMKEQWEIKGSCEQLMDECIVVPLFQNRSSCENEFCRCKSYE